MARDPDSAHFLATPRKRLILRPSSATSAPSAANVSAMLRPTPLLAPVITATLLRNRLFSLRGIKRLVLLQFAWRRNITCSWCSQQPSGPSINSEQSPTFLVRFDAGVRSPQPGAPPTGARSKWRSSINLRPTTSSNRFCDAPLYLVLPVPDCPRCAAAAV
jgi:hypothetical protein